jgi:hypothetical protein
MADISGAFAGRSNFSLHLAVNEISTSQSTNSSTVSIYLYILVDGTGTSNDYSNTSTYSLTVNGTTYTGNYNYDFSGKAVGFDLGLFATNLNIPHASDGSKTITFSASSSAASPLGAANATGGSLTLTRLYLWGDRRTASAWTPNTIAKRWNGTTWVELTTAKRWSGAAWVNLS